MNSAWRALAAVSAGCGGLLVELVVLRRAGLLLGNTSAASAWVLASFLLGLGIGGLWVGTTGRFSVRRLRALGSRGAATIYAVVALAVALGDIGLRLLGPLPTGIGVFVLALHPGLAAIAMGVAFPLLFDGRTKAGVLVGANLLGSVLACGLGGNLLLPEVGYTWSSALAIGCYVAAAGAALRAARTTPAVEPRAGDPPSVDLRTVDLRTAEPHAIDPTPRRSVPTFAYAAALLAGFGTLAFEILLLRRMPFFLEGFQPTLSGVLASCLLALACGAAGLAPLLAACCRGDARTALAIALGAAGIASVVPIHELVGPSIARIAVTTDFGMHLRIWSAAWLAAAPLCLALGAVVPLAVDAVAPPRAARSQDTARIAVAGRLFCAQGVGALCGAIGVASIAPRLMPQAFFVGVPLAIGFALLFAMATIGARRTRRVACFAIGATVLAAALGWTGPGRLFDPDPPVAGSRYDRPQRYRYLDHRVDSGVTASVVYDRATHGMILFTDEFRAAYTGPDTAYMKVLGHLPFLLRSTLRDVAVIALGTGTTADAVSCWPDPATIDVVEISPAVLSLVDRFEGDGPVPTGRHKRFLRDPRTRVHVADGRRWLALREVASLDLVTMEPLLPYAPGTGALYSREFYALAASRLRAEGLLVQWVPTHAMPIDDFATLLATFGRAFEHTSVWLVDQSTLLVGSASPHVPSFDELRARFAEVPPLAGETLHEAGLARASDLEVAFLGTALRETFAGVPELTDERPFLERVEYWSGEQRLSFLPDNLAQLAPLCRSGLLDATDAVGAPPGAAAADEVRRARLSSLVARGRAQLPIVFDGVDPDVAVAAASGARAARPASVLLHHEERLAWRLQRERAASLAGDAGDLATAAGIASRQLQRDGGSAWLLACAALSVEGTARERAVERALAVDPTVFDRAPAWLATLAPLGSVRSPLEDLGELPAVPQRLAELALRDDAFGAGVRAVYPVRCARAIVALAATNAIDVGVARAVFDPASLDAFADAVRARLGASAGACAEIGRAWRNDLPMPFALASMVGESAADVRRAVAAAIAGHRGPRALAVLATLLEDDDYGVRETAGAALFESVRDAVMFDPQWPAARRSEAARAVRELHGARR